MSPLHKFVTNSNFQLTVTKFSFVEALWIKDVSGVQHIVGPLEVSVYYTFHRLVFNYNFLNCI